MWAKAGLFSRRNIVVLAVFTAFACTLFLTSRRLNSGACPGPFCLEYTDAPGRQKQQQGQTLQSQTQQDDMNLPSGLHESDRLLEDSHDAATTPLVVVKPVIANTPSDATATAVASSQGTDVVTSPGQQQQQQQQHKQQRPLQKNIDRLDCSTAPDLSNVFVVLKTGASEAYNRIPTQLMTNMKCVPNLEIWSDMEQTIAGQHIFDSLTQVRPEVKEHKDFEIYHHQAKCPVDQEVCNKGYDTAGKGWSLDKYKNIHIAEANWAHNKTFDWYFYIDADTYVSWPTLAEWFKQLDPSKPAYFGNVALLGGFPFGHGGSGYVVSNAGMKKMFDGKAKVANKYDEKATTTCCGDYLFAYAIKEEAKLDIQNMWPTINGEKPYTMPYYKDHWCQPIVTMHHAVSEEIDDLDKFERSRNFKAPVLIKDVFYGLVQPKLSDTSDDWDNMSDDEYYFEEASRQFDETEQERRKKGDYNDAEKKAHESFDNCKAACESLPDCVQFRFGRGICGTATAVRYGKPGPQEEDDYWKQKSGWMVNRINEWANKTQDCGDVEYPKVEHK